ncbi:hypothetical protein BJ912DRAFT_1043687 [Pholiota molesta]|nr:hypothetical protein BJ912DRAFT_1043687 [Pholiota molesta]
MAKCACCNGIMCAARSSSIPRGARVHLFHLMPAEGFRLPPITAVPIRHGGQCTYSCACLPTHILQQRVSPVFVVSRCSPCTNPAPPHAVMQQQPAPPSAGRLRPLYVRGPSLAGQASEVWETAGWGDGRGWEASGGTGVAGAHGPGGLQRAMACRRGAVAVSLVAASRCCGEVDVYEWVGKVGGATGAPAGSPALESPLCFFPSPFHPLAFPKTRAHIPVAGEGLERGCGGAPSNSLRSMGQYGRGAMAHGIRRGGEARFIVRSGGVDFMD